MFLLSPLPGKNPASFFQVIHFVTNQINVLGISSEVKTLDINDKQRRSLVMKEKGVVRLTQLFNITEVDIALKIAVTLSYPLVKKFC